MNVHHDSLVERLARQAFQLGADALVIECKDRYEEVVASQAGVGYGRGWLLSSGRTAARLRQELRLVSRRPRRIVIDGDAYELRGAIDERFGEDAFGSSCGGWASGWAACASSGRSRTWCWSSLREPAPRPDALVSNRPTPGVR